MIICIFWKNTHTYTLKTVYNLWLYRKKIIISIMLAKITCIIEFISIFLCNIIINVTMQSWWVYNKNSYKHKNAYFYLYIIPIKIFEFNNLKFQNFLMQVCFVCEDNRSVQLKFQSSFIRLGVFFRFVIA